MKKIYLIATIVAIITGIVVYLFVGQLTSKSMKTSEDVVGVVVANEVIEPNAKITKEMVRLSYIPKVSIADNAVSNTADAIGLTAACKIGKNEQLLKHKILTVGDIKNEELQNKIHPGNRAMTLSVDEIAGMAGNLKVGDKVDIIASHTKDKVSTTYMFLQNVSIISVGNVKGFGQESKGYNNITIEIAAGDCVKLFNEYLNGFLTMVLRGKGDDSYAEVPAVIN